MAGRIGECVCSTKVGDPYLWAGQLWVFYSRVFYCYLRIFF